MPSFTVEQNYEQASVLLQALSNPHRLLVLCHLTRGEKCVGDLEALVGLSQSALSQHLARLRHDGLVKTRRDAQTIFYSLRGEKAQTIINTLAGMFEADVADDRLAACS
ncbi:MAG: helix-turn-helix transcriptional regulator [Kangiella sp.]|nr:helix-turn-helix transcriptional regulator [Kangiella sp.]